jgi:hypothetical protein
VRYLWAERFARKMKDRPKRLGVHYLLCATHHLMCSDDFYAIYGWWSSDAACPILLFSTGGLALPRDGDAAGRVVANAIVQSLACQIVEEAGAPTPIHEDGPKDCPFYFNEERVEESIVGPNRFDARCRARLRRELPAKLHGARRADLLRAFDALLDCFATRAPRA